MKLVWTWKKTRADKDTNIHLSYFPYIIEFAYWTVDWANKLDCQIEDEWRFGGYFVLFNSISFISEKGNETVKSSSTLITLSYPKWWFCLKGFSPCFVFLGFNVAFNIFSVITLRCMVDAHFYSAASLKYHAPDTWHDTSHIILALDRPVLALPRKSEQQIPICKDFGMSRPGLEHATSRSRSGRSSNWATGAGLNIV